MERVRLTFALMILCLLTTTGCLFRSKLVQPKLSHGPLKSATQAELVADVNQLSDKIKSLNATVDIDTTVGGEKKGKVVEYQQIRGYILAEKPKLLRMIGLLPIVRNRAFDMVSNGDEFKLSIPPKNRFITGSAEVTVQKNKAANSLENLRPQVIYNALLMQPIDDHNEIAVVEEGIQQVQNDKDKTMVDQPNYHLMVIRRGAHDEWHLYRQIYFNRADLQPYRQTFYNEDGSIATDAVYSDPHDFDGIRFPSLILIVRPQEEYSIAIKMRKLSLNVELKPEQFQMQAPEGATLVQLK
jgi:outer membrane lipoprotein-sorting protein